MSVLELNKPQLEFSPAVEAAAHMSNMFPSQVVKQLRFVPTLIVWERRSVWDAAELPFNSNVKPFTSIWDTRFPKTFVFCALT